MNITKLVDWTLYNYLVRPDIKNLYEEKPEDFKLLMDQIADNEDLQDRKNMRGHVTSSFMLLNPEKTKVLMIFHNVLQKWLAPGGHYEGQVSIVHSALRELEEETGYPRDQVTAWNYTGFPLIDVDSHTIPENTAKLEGPHVHHDFLFLGVAANEHDITPQFEEVSAVKWVELDKLLFSSDARVARAVGKIINMIHPDMQTAL